MIESVLAGPIEADPLAKVLVVCHRFSSSVRPQPSWDRPGNTSTRARRPPSIKRLKPSLTRNLLDRC
jgi:hypothetical protein